LIRLASTRIEAEGGFEISSRIVRADGHAGDGNRYVSRLARIVLTDSRHRVQNTLFHQVLQYSADHVH
jgi:hypothetical protein